MMLSKYFSSLLVIHWHLIIFIFFFSHPTIGSQDLPKLIKRDLLLDRNNVPKNILATSVLGGGSHLGPLTEILKILMDRGYNVTLVAPGNFTAQSDSYRSIPQIITEEKTASRLANQEILKKALFEELDYRILFKLFDNNLYTKYFNIFKRTAEEINADLFICDIGMNPACLDVAWKLEKPVVGFSSSMVATPPPYKSDPMFGCHVNMENESFYERFKCAIVKPLQILWYIKTHNDLNKQREKLGVEPYWNPIGRIDNILLLFDTFFGFEIPIATLPLHQGIGPILPDTFPNLTPALDSFLNTHPRTLYFSLGTNVFTTSQNIVILLKSFLELINQNIIDGVIWASVVTNTTELMSLNNIDFPISDILNNNYPHIYITKFAPQFAILSHENTKIFLSHGGQASSHESIYTSTPMLLLPIAGDQLGNAERLELAGVALRLSKLNLNINDIVLKVGRLLNEESFKINSQRLQFVAKVNSKRKYRAADLIEIVMNTMRHEGVKDENGNLRIDNNGLLKDWITADTRMGFIRGNYIDVYGTFIVIFLAFVCGISYALLKAAKFFFTQFIRRIRNFKLKKD